MKTTRRMFFRVLPGVALAGATMARMRIPTGAPVPTPLRRIDIPPVRGYASYCPETGSWSVLYLEPRWTPNGGEINIAFDGPGTLTLS